MRNYWIINISTRLKIEAEAEFGANKMRLTIYEKRKLESLVMHFRKNWDYFLYFNTKISNFKNINFKFGNVDSGASEFFLNQGSSSQISPQLLSTGTRYALLLQPQFSYLKYPIKNFGQRKNLLISWFKILWKDGIETWCLIHLLCLCYNISSICTNLIRLIHRLIVNVWKLFFLVYLTPNS